MADFVLKNSVAAACCTQRVWTRESVVVLGGNQTVTARAWAFAFQRTPFPIIEISDDTLYQATADAVAEILLAKDRSDLQLSLATTDAEWNAIKDASQKLLDTVRDLWLSATKSDKEDVLDKLRNARELAGAYVPIDLALYLDRAEAKIVEWTPPVD